MLKIRKKKDIPTLIGKKFERLLVIDMISSDITGDANHVWKAICDCGNEKIVNSFCLKYKKTKSCGCYQREMFLNVNVKHTNNFALNALVYDYKLGAKRRNIDFKLSHDECDNLFSKNCYYCGIEPFCIKETISKKYRHSITYNGIDRIDNKSGYIIENVVSCCKFCNVAKHDMTFNDFLNWCKRLSINMKINKLI